MVFSQHLTSKALPTFSYCMHLNFSNVSIVFLYKNKHTTTLPVLSINDFCAIKIIITRILLHSNPRFSGQFPKIKFESGRWTGATNFPFAKNQVTPVVSSDCEGLHCLGQRTISSLESNNKLV